MPQLTEVSVSYSLSIRANLGNWEHGDTHISRSERWNVEGLTLEEADALYEERYEILKGELGSKAESEYREMLGK